MAHSHHHPHDHHHHHHDDDHHHHHAPVSEEPLDVANQSLSDALRASFRVLKGIMVVLVVLYIFSNVRRVEVHEEAVVLRMGRLTPRTYSAEVAWGFPFPIDEIVPLPTKRSNEFTLSSHTFRRDPADEGKALSFIAPKGSGLHPGLDGALMTSDGGLVHMRWKITYKFNDIRNYVSNIASRQIEAAQSLIETFVENSGIHVAGEMTAEEILRTRSDEVQNQLKTRVNAKLKEIDSGVEVTRIEMFEPTPPLQIRDAFDATQKAENHKQKMIVDAEQSRIKLLSEAAGASHPRVIALLDKIDAARTAEKNSAANPAGDAGTDGKASTAAAKPELAELETQLSTMLDSEVEGEAGRMIKDAGTFLSILVNRIKSDVEEYRTLVPEFERTPALLVGRLWERTRREIMYSSGVNKIYFPPDTTIWLKIPFDPEMARLEEEKRLQKDKFDPSKVRRGKMVPLGPEAG